MWQIGGASACPNSGMEYACLCLGKENKKLFTAQHQINIRSALLLLASSHRCVLPMQAPGATGFSCSSPAAPLSTSITFFSAETM